VRAALFFAVCLTVSAAHAAERPRVILVGDSTMAAGSGYGDALCGLFLWQVDCVNLARGGRSTKSYRADGTWDRVMALLRDRSTARATYVLVQFGHNDQPSRPERATDLATEFPANLERYVDEIRAEDARPVLLTPLTRRQFDAAGKFRNDLEPWAEAARRVAKRKDVPLLDLNADSAAAVERMGPKEADTLARPPGYGFDHTHVGPKGAGYFARMVASGISRSVPALAAHFVVGAVEPAGRVARPQLEPSEAGRYAFKEVLGGWDPQAYALTSKLPATPDLVVDANAPPDAREALRTVQSAIDAAVALAAKGHKNRVQILVKPGVYEERVDVPAAAPPITLYADHPDPRTVRIRWTLDAVRAGSTPASYATRIRARGFQARNVTFENGYNKDAGDLHNHSQAVAVMLDDADEAFFDNVRFIGFQDTLYLAATSPERPARAYFLRSYIEGDMDFIFGEATAYFRDTEIRTLGDRAVSYALAPSTHAKSPYGFVFDACRFTHDGTPNARAGVFKLARQWNRGPEFVGKVAILNSSIGAHIDPVRPWADWSIGTPRYRPVNYDYLHEYNNTTDPR
jgi:pectin methylesterase-like acyl-CoA thioesterase/lysophospholipase L1-like esterase